MVTCIILQYADPASVATVEIVKQYILNDPEIRDDKSKYIEGWGWDHTKWTPEQWPTAVTYLKKHTPQYVI